LQIKYRIEGILPLYLSESVTGSLSTLPTETNALTFIVSSNVILPGYNHLHLIWFISIGKCMIVWWITGFKPVKLQTKFETIDNAPRPQKLLYFLMFALVGFLLISLLSI